MKDLQGKVAVITGAASGIGRATATALAREGCQLALVDNNDAGLRETAGGLGPAGGAVSTHVADVADAARMSRLAQEVHERHGHVHLLLNIAGVAVIDLFRTGTLEDLAWIMGVNFWGVVHGCRSFLPYLVQEQEAQIVNMSSVYGLVGVPSQSYYCATKFAVRGFSDALRVELADTPVKVSCIYCGGVKTGIAEGSRFGTSWNGDSRQETVSKFALQARSTPAQAARTIVRGIRRGQRRIRVGRDAVAVDLITRLLPAQGPEIIAGLLRRSRARLSR